MSRLCSRCCRIVHNVCLTDTEASRCQKQPTVAELNQSHLVRAMVDILLRAEQAAQD